MRWRACEKIDAQQDAGVEANMAKSNLILPHVAGHVLGLPRPLHVGQHHAGVFE